MADVKRIEVLAERIRVDAEGALASTDQRHKDVSLTLIAEAALELLALSHGVLPDKEPSLKDAPEPGRFTWTPQGMQPMSFGEWQRASDGAQEGLRG